MRWDQRLFEQALYTVLDNARQYTTDGSVSVDVACDGRVRVSISNQAPHMSEAEVVECLRMHGRGSRASQLRPEGSGLGVPLAKVIIEAHKGQFRFTSPGESIVVMLEIPIGLE